MGCDKKQVPFEDDKQEKQMQQQVLRLRRRMTTEKQKQPQQQIPFGDDKRERQKREQQQPQLQQQLQIPFGDDKREKQNRRPDFRRAFLFSLPTKLIHSLVVCVGDGVKVGYVEGCALYYDVFVVDL